MKNRFDLSLVFLLPYTKQHSPCNIYCLFVFKFVGRYGMDIDFSGDGSGVTPKAPSNTIPNPTTSNGKNSQDTKEVDTNPKLIQLRSMTTVSTIQIEGLDSSEADNNYNTTMNNGNENDNYQNKFGVNQYNSSKNIELARQITAGAEIDHAIENENESDSSISSRLYDNGDQMNSTQRTGTEGDIEYKINDTHDTIDNNINNISNKTNNTKGNRRSKMRTTTSPRTRTARAPKATSQMGYKE